MIISLQLYEIMPLKNTMQFILLRTKHDIIGNRQLQYEY